MAPVFGHGRLRLYLLGLLDQAPRHGYEVIRLLEERFHGMYAPSAGTVYPRLAKLEQEGLVSHTTEGGRKVYSLTEAGRDELDRRREELAELEREIHESVRGLAVEIREDVRSSAQELREEVRAAAARAHVEDHRGAEERGGAHWAGPWGDRDAWRAAKQEWQRAKREMKQQARMAKEESRRAEQESKRARQEAAAARDQAQRAQAHARAELLRLRQRFQEQVQEHLGRGDWPSGVLDGVSELTRELAALAGAAAARPSDAGAAPPAGAAAPERAVPDWAVPEWAGVDDTASTDPRRDLERLLDHFRDDVRDAARDRGLTAEQLGEVRRHLSEVAATISLLLDGR
ncbi:PadR family transcriptional regulator [Wenjunlia vitaminophila]|uniref:PadR family transcriptional regulator n=1 Tax=Wenjunlia vitaminophila TaxID=76728 RepID=A0A0T6LMM6_WENVI|nr:PadR family transcriptional regulator [Wenjunlia vitaminophila]KRV47161.1 PadR family transcriptional regulator [Wenjunlia vitaminophila]